MSLVRRRLNHAAPLDGLLLALHGSMFARGSDDCDGTIIEASLRASRYGRFVLVLQTTPNALRTDCGLM